MNEGSFISEKLEAYIRNELPATERAEFETLLRQDPLLQNELTLQQDIIASLQEYRRQELKSRLNRIGVNSSNGSSLGGYLVGGVLLGGLTAAGIVGYLLSDKPDATIETETTANTTVQPFTEADTTPSSASSPVTKEPEAVSGKQNSIQTESTETARKPDEDLPKAEVTEQTPPQANPESRQPIRAKDPAAQLPAGDAPELSEEHPTQPERRKNETRQLEELTAPRGEEVNASKPASNELKIVDNTNKKYKLHYQYRNGQLSLYGFDKPFEVVEADLGDGQKSYLFYEGNFYKLDRSQTKISPVEQITEKTLITELQHIRENQQKK